MEQKTLKAPKGTFLRILKFILHDQKLIMVLTLISAILGSLGIILAMRQFGDLVDILEARLQNGDISVELSVLFNEVLPFLGLVILIAGTRYFESTCLTILARKKIVELRVILFTHLQKLPLNYFDTTQNGRILSLFTNDIDALRQFVAQALPLMFICPLHVSVMLITLFITSPLLAIVVTVMALLMCLAGFWIAKKSGKLYTVQQTKIGALNAITEEYIEGQRVVKAFNYENKAQKMFDDINVDLRGVFFQAASLSNSIYPTIGGLGKIMYALVAVVGGMIAINYPHLLTFGLLASFLLLVPQFVNPIAELTSVSSIILLANAGAGRVFETLDLQEELDNGTITMVSIKKADDETLNNSTDLVETSTKTYRYAWKNNTDNTLKLVEGIITFNNVNFSYTKGKQILHNVSLHAKKNQKIALVGSTGAGKTTITNLINRFYEIDNGEITIDGINIKDIQKESLRHCLGIVLQDVNLFSGTVAQNIAYGNPDASIEEIIEAAKLANAHDFIMHLENQYETVLKNGGADLSQGEKQLISIARTILVNPPILILDEATSSIDTKTELLVKEGMNKLMENRASFVIAHRLSTIQDAKAILVISDGAVIERGNHETLMEQKGMYYQFNKGLIELD